MGYIKHNAIIVTDSDLNNVIKAREKAIEIFSVSRELFLERFDKLVSPIIGGVANEQYSFFIAPDGSKEGWGTSDECDSCREEFLNWLNSTDYFCDYVEIRFGGDDDSESIVNSKDKYLNSL